MSIDKKCLPKYNSSAFEGSKWDNKKWILSNRTILECDRMQAPTAERGVVNSEELLVGTDFLKT